MPDAPSDPAASAPVEGPGALGRLLPRSIALAIDWALCSLIAYALLGYRWGTNGGADGFKPLLVFGVENLALVSTVGFTIGHRIMGLRVERARGGPVGFLLGLVRTLLLLLVIPAVITDGYGRGFHDRIAGTLIRSTR